MAVDALEAKLDAMLARYRASDDEADVVLLGPSVVERCAYCPFVFEGPVGQARQAWADHDCDRPRPPARRRDIGFQIRR